MKIVEIIRVEEGYGEGTFGVMRINKKAFCVTLELSDEQNAPFISSIPAQQYLCKRYSSTKYPDTFEITGVPGRSSILFHKGNTQKDTNGCILLGSSFMEMKDFRLIAESALTFNKFLKEMDGEDEFHLTIKEEY